MEAYMCTHNVSYTVYAFSITVTTTELLKDKY